MQESEQTVCADGKRRICAAGIVAEFYVVDPWGEHLYNGSDLAAAQRFLREIVSRSATVDRSGSSGMTSLIPILQNTLLGEEFPRPPELQPLRTIARCVPLRHSKPTM